MEKAFEKVNHVEAVLPLYVLKFKFKERETAILVFKVKSLYLLQAVHTNFADGAKNINMKIKRDYGH